LMAKGCTSIINTDSTIYRTTKNKSYVLAATIYLLTGCGIKKNLLEWI
jgi:hypothetical protein